MTPASPSPDQDSPAVGSDMDLSMATNRGDIPPHYEPDVTSHYDPMTNRDLEMMSISAEEPFDLPPSKEISAAPLQPNVWGDPQPTGGNTDIPQPNILTPTGAHVEEQYQVCVFVCLCLAV